MSKYKYSVNENFFNRWTKQMAYVLGFTFADGNIHKYSFGWEIQKRDINLLRKFKKVLNCTYPITERPNSCRLRISNKFFIKGAKERGLLPKKNIRNELPKIPINLLRHFIRGFLDGDGWIVHRSGRNEIDLGFAGGNKEFLKTLEKIIENRLDIKGKVRTKLKITPKKVISTTYHLEYFSSNAVQVINWLYDNLLEKDLYLDRKYKKYLEAKKIYRLLWLKMKSKKFIQREFHQPIKEILDSLTKKELNGMQITEILGTSKSSVYRWLAEAKIKCPNGEREIL